MDRIVRDLYRCNFEVFERRISRDSEELAAARKASTLEEQFTAMLSGEQRIAYEALKEARDEQYFLGGENDFAAGYQSGVRMTLAAFPEAGTMPQGMEEDDDEGEKEGGI